MCLLVQPVRLQPAHTMPLAPCHCCFKSSACGHTRPCEGGLHSVWGLVWDSRRQPCWHRTRGQHKFIFASMSTTGVLPAGTGNHSRTQPALSGWQQGSYEG